MRRLAALAGLLSIGCAPVTLYRYSALTPAAKPIAWDGRTPRAGFVAEGSLGTSTLFENYFPKLHDTAVWVAKHSLEGTVAVVPVEGFQVGLHGSFADYAWAEPSATGTMPLPSRPNLFGMGPDIRVSIPLDREGHAGIGLAAEMLIYSIPYARWQLGGVPGRPGTSFGGYTLTDFGSETHFVFGGGGYPSYGFGRRNRWRRVLGVLRPTTGFSDDGFTNTPRNGSTIATYALPIGGVGYGADFDFVHVNAMTFVPISRTDGSGVGYGPGMMITIGFRVGAWSEPRPLGFY